MANMSAVAQRYAASHLAFIIVPLVCAFFIDLVNALLIPFVLANFQPFEKRGQTPGAPISARGDGRWGTESSGLLETAVL